MNAITNKKKFVMVLAMVVAMFCMATPAMANNHGDTGWSAYLNGWNTVDTPNRQKQDASYGYIKAQSVSNNRQIRAWMLGFGNEDVSSATVYMTSGQSRLVSNYTFERFGRKQVHMRIQVNANYSGTTVASGVWSPDSI